MSAAKKPAAKGTARKVADILALLQQAEDLINRAENAEALAVIAKAKEQIASSPIATTADRPNQLSATVLAALEAQQNAVLQVHGVIQCVKGALLERFGDGETDTPQFHKACEAAEALLMRIAEGMIREDFIAIGEHVLMSATARAEFEAEAEGQE